MVILNSCKRYINILDSKKIGFIYPLEDYRKCYWQIVNDSEVHFGEKDDIINETGDHYVNEIYKQRFYDKWIYRGERYTMIFVDTHTDGNKFFGIYDNSKEIKS
jgi:hypothetical protein